MTQYLPQNMGEWMRAVERRLSRLERRRSSGGGGGGGDATAQVVLDPSYTHYDPPLTVRRVGEMVVMMGGVVGGASAGGLIGNIPAGFRPPATTPFLNYVGRYAPPMESGNNMSYVVLPSGDITVELGVPDAWYKLDGFVWFTT